MVGVEPTCREAHEPESCVSANSTTSAKITEENLQQGGFCAGLLSRNVYSGIIIGFFRFV